MGKLLTINPVVSLILLGFYSDKGPIYMDKSCLRHPRQPSPPSPLPGDNFTEYLCRDKRLAKIVR